jgi:hypothetical protein
VRVAAPTVTEHTSGGFYEDRPGRRRTACRLLVRDGRDDEVVVDGIKLFNGRGAAAAVSLVPAPPPLVVLPAGVGGARLARE